MSNIRIELMDSRDEFRPGRSGGSVNWMQLLSGILLLAFGALCVFCPLEVLVGFNVIAAVLIMIAGGINAAAYIRARNTLFEQSGWSLFFAIMLILIGVMLIMFPMVGVAFMGWALGLGAICSAWCSWWRPAGSTRWAQESACSWAFPVSPK